MLIWMRKNYYVVIMSLQSLPKLEKLSSEVPQQSQLGLIVNAIVDCVKELSAQAVPAELEVAEPVKEEAAAETVQPEAEEPRSTSKKKAAAK